MKGTKGYMKITLMVFLKKKKDTHSHTFWANGLFEARKWFAEYKDLVGVSGPF